MKQSHEIYKLSSSILEQIAVMDTKALQRLVRQCDRASETNCAWWEHWCAPLLKRFAKDQLDIRKRYHHKPKEASHE